MSTLQPLSCYHLPPLPPFPPAEIFSFSLFFHRTRRKFFNIMEEGRRSMYFKAIIIASVPVHSEIRFLLLILPLPPAASFSCCFLLLFLLLLLPSLPSPPRPSSLAACQVVHFLQDCFKNDVEQRGAEKLPRKEQQTSLPTPTPAPTPTPTPAPAPAPAPRVLLQQTPQAEQNGDSQRLIPPPASYHHHRLHLCFEQLHHLPLLLLPLSSSCCTCSPPPLPPEQH